MSNEQQSAAAAAASSSGRTARCGSGGADKSIEATSERLTDDQLQRRESEKSTRPSQPGPGGIHHDRSNARAPRRGSATIKYDKNGYALQSWNNQRDENGERLE